MKSWKTTMAGILAIVGGVTGLIFAVTSHTINQATVTGAVTAILTGIGLIFAKDFNVTGGTNPQDGGTVPAATQPPKV
jgi:hypothetical protein